MFLRLGSRPRKYNSPITIAGISNPQCCAIVNSKQSVSHLIGNPNCDAQSKSSELNDGPYLSLPIERNKEKWEREAEEVSGFRNF